MIAETADRCEVLHLRQFFCKKDTVSDMGNRKKFIEHIKNILIAVLFTSAVLLLSFFWKDMSLNDLENFSIGIQENDSYQPELSELTRPGQIEVNFGSGVYAVLSADWQLSQHGIDMKKTSFSTSDDDDVLQDKDADSGTEERTETGKLGDGIYEYLKSLMSQYMTQSDISQERIEKSQYDEVMSYPSITAAFSFDIPFSDFLKNNGIEPPQGSSSVTNVTEISFSSASSENIFIYDGFENAYYRFVTADDAFADRMSAEMSSLISGIEMTNVTAYYTIESLAGIKNDALIPVYQRNVVKSLSCKSEFSITDSSEIRKYEQMFFSSGLDFVRKITENKGSLIYTYGYNQKKLVLDETGRISYSEELDSAHYSDIGFYEGLEEAVDYVKSHGGWSPMMSEKSVPYLSHVSRITSDDGKYNGYRYEFSIKLKGVPVSFTSGSMLGIEVYGSQVTSYERDIVALSQKDDSDTIDVINAIDVITSEYEEIGNILIELAKEKNDETMLKQYSSGNMFEVVTGNIDIIRFCMMRDTNNDSSHLFPAWYIEINGTRFWCSPEDGHILAWDAGEAN